MPVIFRVRLGKTGNSLRISVPKPVIDGFGWAEGDEIELVVTDHEITLLGPKKQQPAPQL
jgi:AbrB family looped-hinge helix DNA binding protein